MNRHQRAAFGPAIRQARKAKGIDQETLAQMTGVSRRTIGSIERGDTVAQREPLEKLMAALDMGPHVEPDDDVQGFIWTITPMLQMVDPSRREQVMGDIASVLLAGIRQSIIETGQWPRPVSDLPSSVPDAIAAHEDGSIAGEQESTNET